LKITTGTAFDGPTVGAGFNAVSSSDPLSSSGAPSLVSQIVTGVVELFEQELVQGGRLEAGRHEAVFEVVLDLVPTLSLPFYLVYVVLLVVWAGGWWLFALAGVAAILALHEYALMIRSLRPVILAAYAGAILSLLGVSYLFMADTENRIAENERLSAQAFYFGEGVAREVKRWFDRPPYTAAGGTNLSRPTATIMDRVHRVIDTDGPGPVAEIAADGSSAHPYYKAGVDRDGQRWMVQRYPINIHCNCALRGGRGRRQGPQNLSGHGVDGPHSIPVTCRGDLECSIPGEIDEGMSH
jgi:hypothetical protein